MWRLPVPPDYTNLTEGDLDDVFFLTADMLFRLAHMDGKAVLSKDVKGHELERTLLDICRQGVLSGLPPGTSKMLMEAVAFEHMLTHKITNPGIMRALAVISMTDILYFRNFCGFSSKLSEMCSDRACYEIGLALGELTKPQDSPHSWRFGASLHTKSDE
jgi:hypothetical protein